MSLTYLKRLKTASARTDFDKLANGSEAEKAALKSAMEKPVIINMPAIFVLAWQSRAMPANDE